MRNKCKEVTRLQDPYLVWRQHNNETYHDDMGFLLQALLSSIGIWCPA